MITIADPTQRPYFIQDPARFFAGGIYLLAAAGSEFAAFICSPVLFWRAVAFGIGMTRAPLETLTRQEFCILRRPENGVDWLFELYPELGFESV